LKIRRAVKNPITVSMCRWLLHQPSSISIEGWAFYPLIRISSRTGFIHSATPPVAATISMAWKLAGLADQPRPLARGFEALTCALPFSAAMLAMMKPRTRRP
jgi:hypothetical protein